MDESPHCALSGEGALEFAQSLENFNEICDPEELKGDYPYQKIRDVTHQNFDGFAGVTFPARPVQCVDQQQAHDNAGAETAGVVKERMDEQAHDSVGAVAIDREGFFSMCKFNRYRHISISFC